MPSLPTHVVAAIPIAAWLGRPGASKRLWLAAAVCAVLPEADVVGFSFGIEYGDLLGHRGLTHSLFFAALLSGLVTAAWFRAGCGPLSARRIWLFLFLVTASHGLLDALTSGGLGVAFFAPFIEKRHFFPVRPIVVSPFSLGRFLSGRGVQVVASEALWVWLPAVLLTVLAVWYQAKRRSRGSHSTIPTNR
ncbi:MAG: metal-dependent hydrolase [Gemmatimonadota bacterium]|nr:MAG: metal-dependent hydrolase [Gemmatimonadota bacterium]